MIAVEVSPDHFIGGERVASPDRFEDISPIDGTVIAEVSRGGAREADAAVRAAHAAFPAWAALGPTGRAPYLHRLADLIDANVERLAEVECARHGDAAALPAGAGDLARRAQLPRLRRSRASPTRSATGARTAPGTASSACPPARPR